MLALNGKYQFSKIIAHHDENGEEKKVVVYVNDGTARNMQSMRLDYAINEAISTV
jgi:Fe-S cluster assembly iron-binding protein IscA